MDAVIMAGGLGTRLRPLTYAIPKPLLPIGDRPILEILLVQLARAGFTRVHVSTGYKGELIKSYFGDGHRFGCNIAYAVQEPAAADSQSTSPGSAKVGSMLDTRATAARRRTGRTRRSDISG